MRDRKKGETDAAYIARLETANASLRSNNRALSDRMAVYDDRARGAASHTRAILLAAAEVCGQSNDPDVLATSESLDQLCGLPWSKTIPQPGNPIAYRAASAFGADAEMVIKSAYERVLSHTGSYDVFSLTSGVSGPKKDALVGLIYELARMAQANIEGQARVAIDRPKREAPKHREITSLQDARDALTDIEMSIFLALEDLEMSRSCLRLDLRAGMYEAIFRELWTLAGAARDVAEPLPAHAHDEPHVPF